MRLSSTLTLIGFLACAVSCVSWNPLPNSGVPLRTGRTSADLKEAAAQSGPVRLGRSLPDRSIKRAPVVAKAAEPAPSSADPGSVDAGSADSGSVDPGSVDPGSVDPGSLDPKSDAPSNAEAGSADLSSADSSSVDPTSVQPSPVRLLASEFVLDASVADTTSSPYGRIQDLLLDLNTGSIVGVLIARTVAPESPPKAVLHFQSLAFDANGDGAPRITLERSPERTFLTSTDYTDLLESYGLTEVSGDIIDKGPVEASSSKGLILKVRDQGNLLHRVLIEPANLVTAYAGGWKPGGVVRVEGVLTRDSVGKLLVARSVTQNGEVLSLRDEKGRILWENLVQPFRSARALSQLAVQTTDGSRNPIVGWIINVQLGSISHLCFDVDGTVRALPWTAVERASDLWTTSYDRKGLSELPEVVSRNGLVDLP